MTTSSLDNGLGRFIADWAPSDLETHDVISPQRVREVAATLNVEYDATEGAPLPPLWQWAYFPDWVATSDLGPDGHPRLGHFLPPLPNRRRMFAGGRIAISSPLTIGELAVRHSTIVDKEVKHGRTGELLFVTVRHNYLQRDELRITEEQDLVYRSDTNTPVAFSPSTELLGQPTTRWASVPNINAMTLFRFSAVTGNTHRIHYDGAYTTDVEGFPALVVHGPLLAIYMAELARGNGENICAFDFRLSRPVFLVEPIRVQGEPTDDQGSAALAVVTGSGTVHATAEATFG